MSGFVAISVTGTPGTGVEGGSASTTFEDAMVGGEASTSFADAHDGGSATSTEDAGDVSIPCRTMVPEIAAILAAQGIDPSRVNTVDWPAYGASRWATATVLMDRDSVDGASGLKALLASGGVGGGPELFVSLNFGARRFPQMVPGKIIPVVVSPRVSFYVVQLHCRRWLWRHVKAIPSQAFESVDVSRGYNTIGLSRRRYRRRTLASDAKWDFADIVDRVLSGDPVNGYPALRLSTDETLSALGGSLLTTPTILADVSADDTAPGVIDRVLARSGQVLAFVPNAAEDGYSIRIEQVSTGEARAATFLDAHEDDLIAGGMECLVSATVSGTVASNAVGSAEGVVRDCPKAVRVHFPFATTDQSDEVMAEGNPGDFPVSSTGHGSVLDGKSAATPSWDTSTGRPFDDEARMPTIYHVRCEVPVCTFDRDSTSGDDLVEDGTDTAAEIATSIGQIYYSRFYAGACDLWFRDTLQLSADTTWTGAQWWTWQLRQDEDGFDFPVTNVRGDRDCELFGYEPASGPEPVLGFGTVTAWTGSDGAVRVVGHQTGPIPVMLRIKSYAPIGGETYRWLYSCVILQRDDAEPDGWSEGQSVDARNTVENQNTASYAGPGHKLPLSSAPFFVPLPIGEDRDGSFTETDVPGLLVEDRKYADGRVAYFGLSNAIDGDC